MTNPPDAIPVDIFTGTLAPLPGCGRETGMFKRRASGRLEIGSEGFVDDRQADRRVHGGPEKALHLYPAGHYARLAARFPAIADRLVPGSLGENLSTFALAEADVCIGDIFRFGSVRLQVCQPRSPCWKIDSRYGIDGVAAHIAETGLTGWYWRVLQPGQVDSGEPLMLVERSEQALPLAEAMRIWRAHRPSLADLERVAGAAGIAPGWRQKILARAEWLRQRGTPPPAPPPFHVKPSD